MIWYLGSRLFVQFDKDFIFIYYELHIGLFGFASLRIVVNQHGYTESSA